MRLVIPEALQLYILYHYHTNLQGGHQGIGRTYDRIRDHFHWRGYVIAKASTSRSAQTIVETYEECVFRRFDASEVIRHDHGSQALCLISSSRLTESWGNANGPLWHIDPKSMDLRNVWSNQSS
ncbi:hypothetical protein PHMEG_00037600 [Phytophthora megakarya]|uniref:Integrase zinc-binding domain-containing protein n=1 Tax=Phytophthora megakarya TaxID=4795 RepID=A0A225UJ79_9STRA|nr:hypothetical protein PHMEG_00037600 [Phytophthora megakarya]